AGSPQAPDMVIGGGGAAGCVAGARLVDAGARVLLLEAGPDYGPRSSGGWPSDLLAPEVVPTSHDLGYTSRGPGGQLIAHPRAALIGGWPAHHQSGRAWGSGGFPGGRGHPPRGPRGARG